MLCILYMVLHEAKLGCLMVLGCVFFLLSLVEECCLTGMPIQLRLDDEKITPF